jgi:hypothetical protein
MRWKPVPERNVNELGGPMKRMVPRGLILGKPGRQAPVQDSGGIECGTCHMVIYKVDGVFDAEAFQAARRKHYSVSPACEGREHRSGKEADLRSTG